MRLSGRLIELFLSWRRRVTYDVRSDLTAGNCVHGNHLGGSEKFPAGMLGDEASMDGGGTAEETVMLLFGALFGRVEVPCQGVAGGGGKSSSHSL